jgi:hypothetical protein
MNLLNLSLDVISGCLELYTNLFNLVKRRKKNEGA